MDLCGSTQWLTLNVEFSINRLALLQVSKFKLRHPISVSKAFLNSWRKSPRNGIVANPNFETHTGRKFGDMTKGGVSGLSPITQTSHDQSQKLAPRTGVGFLCTSRCLSRAWLVFLHLLVLLAGLRTLINCLSKRTIIPDKIFLLLLRVTFFFLTLIYLCFSPY